MADDLLIVLTRFHREVVLPDMERVAERWVTPLRQAMSSNFDSVYKRFDRLESEYHSLSAAVGRVEERIAAMEAGL